MNHVVTRAAYHFHCANGTRRVEAGTIVQFYPCGRSTYLRAPCGAYMKMFHGAALLCVRPLTPLEALARVLEINGALD